MMRAKRIVHSLDLAGRDLYCRISAISRGVFACLYLIFATGAHGQDIDHPKLWQLDLASPSNKIEFEVKEGDSAFIFEEFIYSEIRAVDDFKFDLAGIKYHFAPGYKFNIVLPFGNKSKGGSLSNSTHYCSNYISSSELVSDQGLSNFKKSIAFCFIDSDLNGTFDYVLIDGAKNPDLKSFIPISPVRYKRGDLVAVNSGKTHRLVVQKIDYKARRVNFKLKLFEDGKQSGIYIEDLHIRFIGNENAPYTQKRSFWLGGVNGECEPQQVFGSNLCIESIDEASKAVKFRLSRKVEPFLRRPGTNGPNLIFIYY